MLRETPEQFVQLAREKSWSEQRIIDVLCRKLNREREYLENTRENLKKTKAALNASRRESGRLITTYVTHIVKDNWKTYCWYKNSRYLYEGNGVWVFDKSKKQDLSYIDYQVIHGKIKVNLLLDDKDMPKSTTGTCSGYVNGKSVILIDDPYINIGDEFMMTRKDKNNG